MLEETKKAEQRVNEERTKRITFNVEYHFVDIEKDHTDHLKTVLEDKGYFIPNHGITIHNSAFDEVAPQIIERIRKRQPIAGRALILLDQTGYSQVKFTEIRTLLNTLQGSEVILTFSEEMLIRQLIEKEETYKRMLPLGLQQQKIGDLIEIKNGQGGRALIQRLLRDTIREITGATYDTPFFINPKQSRRSLWFLHLSRHPTARDVMTQCHWINYNSMQHYGDPGLYMMGFDGLLRGDPHLFNFEDEDMRGLIHNLIKETPNVIMDLDHGQGVPFEVFKETVSNNTAARFSDLEKATTELLSSGDLDVLTKDGKQRSKRVTKLANTDVIRISRQQRLFRA